MSDLLGSLGLFNVVLQCSCGGNFAISSIVVWYLFVFCLFMFELIIMSLFQNWFKFAAVNIVLSLFG